MYNIIKNYVDRLTINDIKMFALKNEVYLSDNELTIVFNTLKKDLVLLLTDSDKVFLSIKNQLSEENYHKIYYLFNEYKKRYKNYL